MLGFFAPTLYDLVVLGAVALENAFFAGNRDKAFDKEKHLAARTKLVIRIGLNKKGRDFIVTDVHGAFSTLLKALCEVKFDPACDRLFVNGDLIDRGEESARVARFLALPYVFAIRGNHEQMLIDLYANGDPGEDVLRFAARHNGFGWWMTTPHDVREKILALFRELPFIMEVETPRGLVGMVHADVPKGMNWGMFTRRIQEEDKAVTHVAIWGRERIGAIDDNGRPVNGGNVNEDGIEGIGRVYVGHTPQWGGVRQFGNVYAIDTGAIFGETGRKVEGRLTMAELACQTQVLVAPRPPMLVDIRADNPASAPAVFSTKPFGNYVKSS